MQMRNALADPIVDGNERPLRPHSILHSPADQLHVAEEAVHAPRRQLGKGFTVIPRHDEDMPVKERPPVQEGSRNFVLEDHKSRFFTGYDPTEGTLLHGPRVAVLGSRFHVPRTNPNLQQQRTWNLDRA